MPEVFMAIEGYWRKWERDTAWLMREVVYTMIAWNPHYKSEDKPRKEQIMTLSIDAKPEKKKEKTLSPDDIEKIRLELLAKLNKDHGTKGLAG